MGKLKDGSWKKGYLDKTHILTKQVIKDIEILDNVTDHYWIEKIKKLDNTIKIYLFNKKLEKEIE